MEDVVQAASAHAELGRDFALRELRITREHTQDTEARVVGFFCGFGLQLLTGLHFAETAGQATARIFAIADPIQRLC